jgi:hypothetical protein
MWNSSRGINGGAWMLTSDNYQEYIEVAGEPLRRPAMTIQPALKEHDRQVKQPDERVLPDEQQTLSDALGDIVDVRSGKWLGTDQMNN